MNSHIILGVHVTDRLKKAAEVQKLLTEYGGYIKTRLGLHEVKGDGCPVSNGLLLLEMYGEEAKCIELGDKLNTIEGIEVQKMMFRHD